MSLAIPEEPQANIADPGAHELQAADSSDDHFSDADDGHKRLSAPPSPVPTTRVERVDDEPAYGEVPGTSAYKIRTQDAVPDEVEIIPDGQRSRSTSRLSETDRPTTPGGTLIPKMIVEKVDDKPSHGEVPGTAAFELRKADAEPDEVRQAPEEARVSLDRDPTVHDRSRSPSLADQASPPPVEDETHESVITAEPTAESDTPAETTVPEPTDPTTAINEHVTSPTPPTADTTAIAASEDYDEFGQEDTADQFQDLRLDAATEPVQPHEEEEAQPDVDDGDDGFGDDFDDFEEGAEAGEDDDFGDFDDGFQEPEPVPIAAPEPVQDPLAHLPNLTFASFQTPEDILKTISPHLSEIFPEFQHSQEAAAHDQKQPSSNPILTDRSASLWSQLVAPPPLQPPNWIRSRIRRLFLVSLGVPVDLDEILPASKQKKLILPNINLPAAEGNPRGSISRLRKEGQNASTTSISSTGEKKKKKDDKGLERRGPPPPPEFDTNSAGLVSSTTEAAMSGFSDEELKDHVQRLEALIKEAAEVLEYWLARKDSAVGDKEAFEGVIENLVGFVRRNRDSKIYK